MKRLIAVLALLAAAPVWATTYYVANAGNDSNNGTSTGTPWQTVAKVVGSTFSAGDQILFNRGDSFTTNTSNSYNDSLKLGQSGSAGNPIVIGAYGAGAAPIFDGSNIVSSWTPVAPSPVLDENFAPTPSTSNFELFGNSSATKYMGSSFTATGTYTVTRVDVGLCNGGGSPESNAIHMYIYSDSGSGPVTLLGTATATRQDSVSGLCTSTTPNYYEYDFAGVSITSGSKYDIVMQATSVDATNKQAIQGAAASGPIMWASAAGVTWSNWDANRQGTYKIYSPAATTQYTASVTYAPRDVYFNGVRGIKVASAGAVVAATNWYWTGGTLTIYSAVDPAGTTINVSQRDNIIYGNGKNYITVQDITGRYANLVGMYLDGTSHDWIFNRVNSTWSASDGFEFDGSSNTVMLNSDIAEYNHSDGFSLIGGSTAHDVTCNYCVSRYNGGKLSADIAGGFGDGFTAHASTYNWYINYSIAYGNYNTGFAMIETSSGHIWNSVAYGNGGNWNGAGQSPSIRAGLYLTGTAADANGHTWDVKNTIIDGSYPHQVMLSSYIAANASIDYQDYLSPNGSGDANFANVNSVNQTWATYHGTYEAHSQYADPLFTNGSGNFNLPGDFSLGADSPAIGKGTNLGITYGIGLLPGSTWPSNALTGPQCPAWNIGAYVQANCSNAFWMFQF